MRDRRKSDRNKINPVIVLTYAQGEFLNSGTKKETQRGVSGLLEVPRKNTREVGVELCGFSGPPRSFS